MDYENLKTELAEILIQKITHRFPELQDNIKNYYTATPLTYRDYIGSPNGSAYGMIKDSESPFESFVLPKTHIPNLLFTGQNINGHGMLGEYMAKLLDGKGKVVVLRYSEGSDSTTKREDGLTM